MKMQLLRAGLFKKIKDFLLNYMYENISGR